MAEINKLSKIHLPLILLLVFTVTFLPLQAAGAKSPNNDGIIPAGETVLGSQFIFAPEINIAGTVDGDVFAFGQNVTLTGEIKGSLFVLSTTSTIEGRLEGDLFAANARLTLEPTASVGRSAYILAGIVNLFPESQIGRDLYLIGLSGQVSSTVGRFQRAHLGIIEILEMLLGENGMLNPLLPPGFKLPWSGINNLAAQPAEVIARLYATTSGLGLPAFGMPVLVRPQLQTASIDSAALGTWLFERLRAFLPLFLIGLLLLWLFPRFMQGSASRLRYHPLSSLYIGLIVFFVGFGVAFLVLALVVALGLFFAVINYWDLAMLIWGGGLGALSLAMALFGLALGYLSKIIVAFLIGAILLNRLPVTFWGRRIWMLLLGLVLLILVLAIPILGWVLMMLTILFGLGAIYQQLRQPKQQEDILSNVTSAEEISKETDATQSTLEDVAQAASEEIANVDIESSSPPPGAVS